MTITIAFTILGSLALLIFGMKMMSEALQKMAGPKLRHVLARMTTNRFTGMLTGIGVTAAVQSSTATTVMTVSFVNQRIAAYLGAGHQHHHGGKHRYYAYGLDHDGGLVQYHQLCVARIRYSHVPYLQEEA